MQLLRKQLALVLKSVTICTSVLIFASNSRSASQDLSKKELMEKALEFVGPTVKAQDLYSSFHDNKVFCELTLGGAELRVKVSEEPSRYQSIGQKNFIRTFIAHLDQMKIRLQAEKDKIDSANLAFHEIFLDSTRAVCISAIDGVQGARSLVQTTEVLLSFLVEHPTYSRGNQFAAQVVWDIYRTLFHTSGEKEGQLRSGVANGMSLMISLEKGFGFLAGKKESRLTVFVTELVSREPSMRQKMNEILAAQSSVLAADLAADLASENLPENWSETKRKKLEYWNSRMIVAKERIEKSWEALAELAKAQNLTD